MESRNVVFTFSIITLWRFTHSNRGNRKIYWLSNSLRCRIASNDTLRVNSLFRDTKCSLFLHQTGTAAVCCKCKKKHRLNYSNLYFRLFRCLKHSVDSVFVKLFSPCNRTQSFLPYLYVFHITQEYTSAATFQNH